MSLNWRLEQLRLVEIEKVMRYLLGCVVKGAFVGRKLRVELVGMGWIS